MGRSPGIGYLLWAVAKDLVKRYGPWCSIWLCAMGHSEKPITIAQNYATVFKRDSDAKKCINVNSIIEGLHHPSFKFLVSAKFPQGP